MNELLSPRCGGEARGDADEEEQGDMPETSFRAIRVSSAGYESQEFELNKEIVVTTLQMLTVSCAEQVEQHTACPIPFP